MIDRTHSLPVVRQCQLLQLTRSTAYYQALPISETTLALMRRIDERTCSIPLLARGCCAISCGRRATLLDGDR